MRPHRTCRFAFRAVPILGLVLGALATPALAREPATVTRIDAARVALVREDSAPVDLWLSSNPMLDGKDRRIARATRETRVEVALPEQTRGYVILKGRGAAPVVAAERVVPARQASNLRDMGGYVTADGHQVRWGRVFRSAALPLLTKEDDALIAQLGITTDVDLRSIDERAFNPDTIDDRAGMTFIAKDYAMADLMTTFGAGGGENIYKGMEVMLAPQYRSLYRAIMADSGGVLFHCSAGQDRTGVAAAMLYDVLGVDRATILADYHLSTGLRRTEFEFAAYDPAKFPGNVMALAMAPGSTARKANPLYTASGASHLAQFFAHVDARYGGAEGYMRQVLGFSDKDLARLRAAMLR